MRIGVDLGGSKIEAVVLDDDGRERTRRRIATPRGDYDATIAALRELVEAVEAAAGSRRGSVGVAIPGAISPLSGLIKNANSTWLIGRPFDRDLAAALGRPVRLANDANCFALSEATDGAAAGCDAVFGVIIGTGTGGGIVLHGRVHEGPNRIAGEWGHLPLPWPEPEDLPAPACYCGKTGCIETYLSGPGLVETYRRHGGEALAAEAIAERADVGDAAAEAAIRLYERRLARGLAMVITMLDPDAIVLGGGLSNLERLYRTVPALWQDFAFSDGVRTRLLRARHGDSSGVRGAAWLWPREGAS